MKSGFAHFDGASRENFVAAVLLLTMEADDSVNEAITRLVRRELGIDDGNPLVGIGREARLAETDNDPYARVDLWLRFGSPAGAFCAFLELKIHNNWDAAHVAHQVRDQASRTMARGAQRVRGSILLAPERLCLLVQAVDPAVPAISWSRLIEGLRALPSLTTLAAFAIRHMEETIERPTGCDRPLTLSDFEQATTTVACLRQFIGDCIRDIFGRVHGDPLYLPAGDATPLRGSGWAWHGLSVPFSLDGQRGRVGIYKYVEAPTGEESALSTLWLEAYLGQANAPVAAIPFAPATLATSELDRLRAMLTTAWTNERRLARDTTTAD